MRESSNHLSKGTRNFYILQFIRGNITEEIFFDVFSRKDALEIIEDVKLGKMGAKKTLEMLSNV
ncbi:MAG: hypothetical protein ISS48_04640 [Candidatus Aenigmarchaeota archaeon]|nr:hypothetical protein [Candidatus Aenigmarchaeota archaeon]